MTLLIGIAQPYVATTDVKEITYVGLGAWESQEGTVEMEFE